MKLRALRAFCIGKGVDVAVGEVFEEASRWQALYWVGLGMVEEVKEDDDTPKPETAKASPAPRASAAQIKEK